MEIIFFYAGVVYFYYRKISIFIVIGIAWYLRKRWYYGFWFCGAFLWAWLHQYLIFPQFMPTKTVVDNALVVGRVTSIPRLSEHHVQFDFQLVSLNRQSVKANLSVTGYCQYKVNSRRMDCNDGFGSFHELRIGESWQFLVKLKKPINLANPGGFDFVEKLENKHQFWLATIKKSSLNHIVYHDSGSKITELCSWFILLTERLRFKLADSLAYYCHQSQLLGVIEALSLGITTHLQESDWALFRRTGTTHLMVISGSHIGLMAGVAFFVLRRLVGYSSRLCLWVPAQRLAAIGAFIFVSIYALLAGFEVPLQRALVCCGLLFVKYFGTKKWTHWQAWRFALWVVIGFEPHSVRMPGFYLSFIAVAILMLVGSRAQLPKYIRVPWVQIACTVGLLPLCLFWFGYGSLNGILANLLAIPWVELVLVPLSVLSVISSGLHCAAWIMPMLQVFIIYLLKYLAWVDHFQKMNIEQVWPTLWAVILSMGAIYLFYCLPLKRFWLVGGIGLIAAWCPADKRPYQNHLVMDVLDVGQGLSIILKTKHHVLIYDTGGRNFNGQDMGEKVVIPYLFYTHTQKPDAIVISHPDLDHRGGLPSILHYFPKTLVIQNHGTHSCHSAVDWVWDGVKFHFFPVARLLSKNNNSCVLQITAGQQKILLAGDIEAAGELFLVRKYGKNLLSDVLLIPHHGSKTSSTDEFLKNVSPSIGILSYGVDNRYHLPNIEIIKKYRQRHITILDTVHCGMIHLDFDSVNSLLHHCYRIK